MYIKQINVFIKNALRIIINGNNVLAWITNSRL